MLRAFLSSAWDQVQALNAGVGQAGVSLAGLQGDARKAMYDGVVNGGERLGVVSPADAKRLRVGEPHQRLAAPSLFGPAYTSAELQAMLPMPMRRGLGYSPKTAGGHVARTAGEYAVNAAVPGGPAMKVAAVAVPTVGSEAAGALTRGTPYEDVARVAGGMTGVGAVRGIAAPSRGRVFWSDKTKDVAARYAKATGGVTLEQTVPGKFLSASHDALEKVIGRDAAYAKMKPAWRFASDQFARGAQGRTDAILGPDVKANSVWNEVEYPILRRRGIGINSHRVRTPE